LVTFLSLMEIEELIVIGFWKFWLFPKNCINRVAAMNPHRRAV
jgi:hypothetical protein